MEDKVREQNPAFAKLVDVLSSSYLQDGLLKSTLNRSKQVELKLSSIRQRYLEQLVYSEELKKVLQTCSNLPAAECTAASELQHCLELCPGATLLGVKDEHVKAVNPLFGILKSKASIYSELEERLKGKCQKVAHWQAPERAQGKDALELARISQLPQLLKQQREEVARHEEEVRRLKKECDEKLTIKLKVLAEMCSDLKHAVEQYKLATMAEANQLTLSYLQTQCQAMIGKLDVMYHQLLKGMCSDGRLQALQEIRSQLHSARQKIEHRLLQTQQALQQYQNLGEDFVSLAQQYHELLADIENKQWALSELGKSTKQ